jgi:hypothetical protein
MELLAACAADVEAMFDANHAKERAAAAVGLAVAERDEAFRRLFEGGLSKGSKGSG